MLVTCQWELLGSTVYVFVVCLFVCLFVFAAVVLSLKEVGVEVEVEAGVEVIWLEATASRIARQVTNRKSACISGSAIEPHLRMVLERGGWAFAF